MNFLGCIKIKNNSQLIVLGIWFLFIGLALWQHAQRSHLPPIYDASSYYWKGYNFWTTLHSQHKLPNLFNLEPTIRPPGSILISHPFGLDKDYRGFYFRSTFIPILLLGLASIVSSYRKELDNKGKWLVVLFTAFLSTIPCFYGLELTTRLPTVSFYGLIDNFLAGIAAFATALMVRSLWTRSLVWLTLAAVFSSFCVLIKPSGILIMMLIGFTWMGLTMLELKLAWKLPNERKNISRWLLQGLVIFAIPYALVLAISFTSDYLSEQNLAFGKGAIDIMRADLLSLLSWDTLKGVMHLGIGYHVIAWLFLMILLYQTSISSCLYPQALLIGLVLASCGTFIFGIWYWIWSGGITQIRYAIPFTVMATIFALPVILTVVHTMSKRKVVALSALMIIPIVNIAMLLPQRNASTDWQALTGVNLTSGFSDTTVNQAQNFVDELKRQNISRVAMYCITVNIVDAYFSAIFVNALMTMPSPVPIIDTFRPMDWQRSTTYRKKEMFGTYYWMFLPMHDPDKARKILNTLSIDTFEQEQELFETWATQLTPENGVTIFSETPEARILHIDDFGLLEQAFDTLVAKHHWRDTFIKANPKDKFTEKELITALEQNSPSLENINFSDRFHLRALTVSRVDNKVIVRFWWKPLSSIRSERDWSLFIHVIDSEGKILINNGVPIRFNLPLSSLNNEFLFDEITFQMPVGINADKLAIGFIRQNNQPLVADNGIRDWNGQRVIVPLP